MYISLKYVLIYVFAGVGAAIITDSNKQVGVIGAIISGVIGLIAFNGAYGILSAIEFVIGFGLVSLAMKKQ